MKKMLVAVMFVLVFVSLADAGIRWPVDAETTVCYKKVEVIRTMQMGKEVIERRVISEFCMGDMTPLEYKELYEEMVTVKKLEYDRLFHIH